MCCVCVQVLHKTEQVAALEFRRKKELRTLTQKLVSEQAKREKRGTKLVLQKQEEINRLARFLHDSAVRIAEIETVGIRHIVCIWLRIYVCVHLYIPHHYGVVAQKAAEIYFQGLLICFPQYDASMYIPFLLSVSFVHFFCPDVCGHAADRAA